MSGFSHSSQRQESMLVYLKAQRGLQIQYPMSWEVQEKATPFAFAVGFLRPPENPAVPFRDSLTITIQPLLDPISLEDLVEGSFQEMRQGPLTISEPESTTMCGWPAYQVTYSGTQGPLHLECLAITAINDGKVYNILYAAEAGRFSGSMDIIQQMIASLEMT